MLRSTMAIAFALGLGTACTTDLDLNEAENAVSVTWTNVVGVSTSGASITKTATASSWNAGATSTQTLAGNGYVEFSSAETTSNKMAGLSNGNSSTNYSDIDFGFYLMAGGGVRVYEAGAYRGSFGTYSAGDVFRVEVTGTTVTYSVRGTVVYTSTVAPTFPLLLDTALYTPAATLQNATIVDSTLPFWTALVNVSASSTSITKTNATGWSSGAVTTSTLTADGFVQFTSGETTTNKMAGLSNGNPGTSYNEIDYALYLIAGGSVRVYENGAFRKEVGTYAAGDQVRIEVAGSEVRYIVGGAIAYRSAVAPTFPLLLDTALYNAGATIQSVTFGTAVGGSVWENPVGVTMTANSLTKTSATAWNAGAASVKTLSADGYVEFSTAETTTAKIAGLSNGNANTNYTEIDYGVYLLAGGGVRVYENGTLRGVFGTYLSGDVFRVAVVGGAIQYSKNGTLFYTSTVAPTFPLLVDSALYTTGATIQGVTFSP
jgi:hypothetical protein